MIDIRTPQALQEFLNIDDAATLTVVRAFNAYAVASMLETLIAESKQTERDSESLASSSGANMLVDAVNRNGYVQVCFNPTGKYDCVELYRLLLGSVEGLKAEDKYFCYEDWELLDDEFDYDDPTLPVEDPDPDLDDGAPLGKGARLWIVDEVVDAFREYLRVRG